MILITDWTFDGSEAHCVCEACRRAVGWLPMELVVKMCNMREHLFCFDCEGNVDRTPDVLVPSIHEDVVIISEDKTRITTLFFQEPEGIAVEFKTIDP